MKLKNILKAVLAVVALWQIAISMSVTFADSEEEDKHVYLSDKLEASFTPTELTDMLEWEPNDINSFTPSTDEMSTVVRELDEFVQEVKMALEAVNEIDFTIESWMTLQEALIRAVEVLEEGEHNFNEIIDA